MSHERVEDWSQTPGWWIWSCGCNQDDVMGLKMDVVLGGRFKEADRFWRKSVKKLHACFRNPQSQTCMLRGQREEKSPLREKMGERPGPFHRGIRERLWQERVGGTLSFGTSARTPTSPPPREQRVPKLPGGCSPFPGWRAIAALDEVLTKMWHGEVAQSRQQRLCAWTWRGARHSQALGSSPEDKGVQKETPGKVALLWQNIPMRKGRQGRQKKSTWL